MKGTVFITMQKLLSFVEKSAGLNQTRESDLLAALLITLALLLARFLILKLVWHVTENIETRYNWKKVFNYLVSISIILILGNILFSDFIKFSTFLGLLSAGIAIALKDLIINIAGWIFILTRRPFTTGDRIQIGQHSGDVIDIHFFQFTILEIGNWVSADQSTGRIILIPNGKVFTDALANYNKGFDFIWNEIPVRITFESNWEKAKEILEAILLRHTEDQSASAQEKIKDASRSYIIRYSNLTPIIYTAIKDNGILFSLRYLCKPRTRRDSEHVIWQEIFREFAKHDDIKFEKLK